MVNSYGTSMSQMTIDMLSRNQNSVLLVFWNFSIKTILFCRGCSFFAIGMTHQNILKDSINNIEYKSKLDFVCSQMTIDMLSRNQNSVLSPIHDLKCLVFCVVLYRSLFVSLAFFLCIVRKNIRCLVIKNTLLYSYLESDWLQPLIYGRTKVVKWGLLTITTI
jgi:hypothetical protein